MEQGIIDLIHSDELANLKLAGVIAGVDVVLDYILENIGNDRNLHSTKRPKDCYKIGIIYSEYGPHYGKPSSFLWQINIKNHPSGMGLHDEKLFKIKFKQLLTE